MIRFKRPIEYELSPDTIEKGTHWLSVHLKNTGEDHLKNLNMKMHSLDSVHISFRDPNQYIYDLEPGKEKYFELEVEANKTSRLYISIRGRKNGDHFHWDSGLMREQVVVVDAEIEGLLSSRSCCAAGGAFNVLAIVK